MSSLSFRLALFTASTAFLALPASAAVVNCEGSFGTVLSTTAVTPGGPDKVELDQKVRLDRLSSKDPVCNDATLTLFEQSASYPDRGDYKIYGVLQTRTGDKAFVLFAGAWDVVMQDGKFAAAPFEAKGEILGGTGKLEGIKGTVVHKGKVTPAEGGRYTLQLTY